MMSWINTLRISAEDFDTLAENEPPTLPESPGELHEVAGPSWPGASGTSSVDRARAAFEARLLQGKLARLGPSEGDESEEENSWTDSVVLDESEKDDWAAITRWLSVNDGCRAGCSADGS